VAITLESILAPGGLIAGQIGPHFEPRPEQLEMARGVLEAMASRSHLLVEAGTGVGKSFAYLVPAMMRAAERGETVLVATNTIALQEQLIRKDVPLLQSLMDPQDHDDADWTPKIRPILVKGRGNYVSIRRLRLASQRQDRLFADPAARRSLHVIEDWAMTTTDGTLSTLPPVERAGVWDKLQSDSGNCMGRKCPTYDQCFYQSARRQLENANVLICNHALFFSDLALRTQDYGFLPRYDHVILDEAHGVEDAASDHFGVSLAEGRVMHLLSTLLHQRSHKGYLPQLATLIGEGDGVMRAMRLVDDATHATRAFFDSLLALLPGSRRDEIPDGADAESSWMDRGRKRGGGDSARAAGTTRIREPGVVANVLTPALRELSLRLKSLREEVKNDADKFELNAYAVRAEMIATDAETLVSQAMPAAAYWVEATGGEFSDDDGPGAGRRRVTLGCAPIEVAPLLKERLFSGECSVVLTSATLATRGTKEGETRESAETAFAHALSRLGCEGARTLQLGSPFDYASQVEMYVDPVPMSFRGGPRRPARRDEPVFEPDPEWFGGVGTHEDASTSDLTPMSAAVLRHVRETDGGAFVLFTSFAQLNACAAELAGPLSRLGLPLLAQGRDGSRSHILERFRENEGSVLFGAASFWQGVDVRGRGLRNVIITKLPFEPPDRPMTQARSELIESRGGNAFMEDSLPRAVIRFKQGFGRLIRSKSDRGRVVVLDDRIIRARYGRVFLSALPPGVRVRVVGQDGE
jgi:ATP-dependent DNA helicase DinG